MVTIIPPRPLYNRFEIPDNSGKNEEFEKFVLRNLFPKQHYSLAVQNPGYLQNTDSNRQTGYILCDAATGLEFYIHCRYCHALIANGFKFRKTHQLDQHILYKSHPIFLILGLGGTPGAPNEVFLSNFEDCPTEHLLKRHLKGKSIPVNQFIPFSDLWKQEPQQVILSKRIA